MSTIITEIIFGIQERARWRHNEWLLWRFSEYYSSTWRGDSPGDPCYEVGDN